MTAGSRRPIDDRLQALDDALQSDAAQYRRWTNLAMTVVMLGTAAAGFYIVLARDTTGDDVFGLVLVFLAGLDAPDSFRDRFRWYRPYAPEGAEHTFPFGSPPHSSRHQEASPATPISAENGGLSSRLNAWTEQHAWLRELGLPAISVLIALIALFR